MLMCKNRGILVKRNSKIICLYVMLRARTFRVRRKSLGASYKHTHNFLSPVHNDLPLKYNSQE